MTNYQLLTDFYIRGSPVIGAGKTVSYRESFFGSVGLCDVTLNHGRHVFPGCQLLHFACHSWKFHLLSTS